MAPPLEVADSLYVRGITDGSWRVSEHCEFAGIFSLRIDAGSLLAK
jgi:hypothetical protein